MATVLSLHSVAELELRKAIGQLSFSTKPTIATPILPRQTRHYPIELVAVEVDWDVLGKPTLIENPDLRLPFPKAVDPKDLQLLFGTPNEDESKIQFTFKVAERP